MRGGPFEGRPAFVFFSMAPARHVSPASRFTREPASERPSSWTFDPAPDPDLAPLGPPRLGGRRAGTPGPHVPLVPHRAGYGEGGDPVELPYARLRVGRGTRPGGGCRMDRVARPRGSHTATAHARRVRGDARAVQAGGGRTVHQRLPDGQVVFAVRARQPEHLAPRAAGCAPVHQRAAADRVLRRPDA